VSLSLKATQEDPWKEFERKYTAGEIIDGQVTKLVPFGAFVRVAPGIEGLVHISELSDQHVESPESVLSVGDQVRVKVIEVDVARRRISLSMRQVGGAAPPITETEIEEEAPAAAAEEVAMVEEMPVAEPATAAAPAPEAVAEPAPEPTPVPVPVPATVEVAPEPEAVAPVPEPEEEEEVSLEAILEDLKRREGRSE
jgi:small subunit ribosomal protein S1